MPYGELRYEALRILPAEVGTGLEAFARPELEERRRRYAAVLAEILEDRFAVRPFDAFVVPSDVFFYVRAAPEACHRLGVPFFCAQKETTIAPHTMREHAERVKRYAPPIADHMTVCSEHHRRFWVQAGADPSAITVTGQPRFDVLMDANRWPREAGSRPSVLFLSYFVDAYHPTEGRGEPAWARLHRETEEGLWDLARDGWRVLIKPHPQQPVGELRHRVRAAVGDMWEERVVLVDALADVRPILLSSDVVVGFQSTAVLEAMIAGRPTLYTGWDEEARRLSSELIPFHEWGEVIDVVTDARALPATAREARGRAVTGDVLARRRAIAADLLGPLDGGASRRTLDRLRECVEEWAGSRGPEAGGRRADLASGGALGTLRRRSRLATRRIRRGIGGVLGP